VLNDASVAHSVDGHVVDCERASGWRELAQGRVLEGPCVGARACDEMDHGVSADDLLLDLESKIGKRGAPRHHDRADKGSGILASVAEIGELIAEEVIDGGELTVIPDDIEVASDEFRRCCPRSRRRSRPDHHRARDFLHAARRHHDLLPLSSSGPPLAFVLRVGSVCIEASRGVSVLEMGTPGATFRRLCCDARRGSGAIGACLAAAVLHGGGVSIEFDSRAHGPRTRSGGSAWRCRGRSSPERRDPRRLARRRRWWRG